MPASIAILRLAAENPGHCRELKNAEENMLRLAFMSPPDNRCADAPVSL
jgi:hypothetical protein